MGGGAGWGRAAGGGGLNGGLVGWLGWTRNRIDGERGEGPRGGGSGMVGRGQCCLLVGWAGWGRAVRGDSSGTKKKGSARLGSMAEALKTRQAERRKGLSSKALSATDVAAVKGSMEKRMTEGQRKHMDGLKKKQ